MITVFVSSSIANLPEHRIVIEEFLLSLDVNVITMPVFENAKQADIEIVLEQVNQADIFIGIIGNEYGYIVEGMQKSVTHMAYDIAVEKNISCLVYLIDPNYSDTNKVGDKLFRFREVINDEHLSGFFTTPDDLIKKIETNLNFLLAKIHTFTTEPNGYLLPETGVQINGDVNDGETIINTKKKSFNKEIFLGLLGIMVAILSLNVDLFNTPEIRNLINQLMQLIPRERFAEGEIGVLLADFVTYSDTRRGIERTLELEFEASSINYIRVNQVIRDRDHARELSAIYNATIILWGEELGGRIEVNYEAVTARQQRVDIIIDSRTISISDFVGRDSFESFIADGMDSIYVVRFIEGQVAYFYQDFDRAIQLYSEAINLIPSDLEEDAKATTLYVHRGLAHARNEDYESAINDYNLALQLDSTYTFARVNRAVDYANLGDYETAFLEYDSILETNPRYSDVYVHRGTNYADLGDYESAFNDFDTAIRINPNNVFAYNRRGFFLFETGEYNLAIDDFTSSINLDSNNAYAYSLRGWSYYYLENYEEVINDLNIALELDPTDLSKYVVLGNSYDYLSQYDAAISSYNRALEFDPNFASAYYNRAIVYRNLENSEAEIQDYSTTIELDPEYHSAFRARANRYYDLGLDYYPLAITDYKQYATLTGELEPFMIERITEMQEALANQ